MRTKLLAVLCLPFLCGAAAAQTYPSKPISMIVPFAAGGPTDGLGRALGAAMSKSLGQQIIIENVSGAGGNIGVTRADPMAD